jgi:hypothetical protein
VVERERVSFEELMAKVLETIQVNGDEFIMDELFEDGLPAPPTEQDMIDRIKDRVRQASTLMELIELIPADPAV